MYGFVDTIEDAKSTSLSIQTVYNNYNLDEILTDDNGSFNTLTVSGRSNIKQRINQIEVPGMHGLLEDKDPTIDVREIVVKYKISDKTNEGFRNRLNRLNALLSGTKQVLNFTDEDAIFYATLSELDVPEEESNNLIGTITFLCTDPHKYGPEKTMSFPADIVIVENRGTAETDPIFEMEATKKTTFAMISNGDDEYNLIGTPIDDDVQVVDEKISVLYENGSTIDTWQPATLDMIDEHFIKNIGGAMTTDDAGIRANGYGTGEKLHGPAVYKEINPIKNFEIETTFDIISRRDVENFRMGILFTDENMNILGHIGIKDNSQLYKRRTPLARYGEYRGGGRHNGNLIGDSQKNDNARETTLFYLRAKREGNIFDFYIGEWQSQKHIRSWHETYRDVNNELNGKMKYITLYIASYADRVTPARLRINSVEVFELARATVDQTPYILYPGDVVTFDHKDDDILVNGEPRMDLKNFGGAFFKLQKDVNRLIVTPEDSFNTKVKFRERYL